MSVCKEEIFGPVAPVMKFERFVVKNNKNKKTNNKKQKT